MQEKQAQLKSSDILQKNFKTSMRGYNQIEVDEFLDVIIKDYEFFNEEIAKLRAENQKLKAKTAPQQQTDRKIHRSQQTSPNHQVNYDVLKRLSNLEKEVFGKKFADS